MQRFPLLLLFSTWEMSTMGFPSTFSAAYSLQCGLGALHPTSCVDDSPLIRRRTRILQHERRAKKAPTLVTLWKLVPTAIRDSFPEKNDTCDKVSSQLLLPLVLTVQAVGYFAQAVLVTRTFRRCNSPHRRPHGND